MEVTTIGIDLAKNVFAVCGADSSGRVLMRRQLRHTLWAVTNETKPRSYGRSPRSHHARRSASRSLAGLPACS